ncbi:YHYH protein [Ornithinimicrobium sp. Arc0846-15]|nr:YHYH protein [Ornithinimicrobium laminariae]
MFVASCSSDTTDTEASSDADTAVSATSDSGDDAVATTDAASDATAVIDCDYIADSFRDVTSANEDLPDPALSAACEGDTVEVASNTIPDYEYVGTSPGDPEAQDMTMSIPAEPVVADETSPVAELGPIAMAVNGVPIYGPTEGTGGDVLSLEGALSECGSHNGPTGFHLHLLGAAEGVDCMFSAEELESETLLVGWSPDGFPIMSGQAEGLTSSYELTDESLFATDTLAAHSYVEGLGDLDECNGRMDDDGQYRYYTTDSYPYYLGCYTGEVAEDALSGVAGGPGQG